MKCTIPGIHVKVFGKAIHSLSKIGEELYFEPLEHGLALRTVNACRSAYACFVFAPSFFTHYDDGSGHIQSSDSEDEVLKCKIGMKSCLTVFKSLSTLEKTVDKCKIALDMKESRLVFQLYRKHGIVKTYNLAFIECETLQAVFAKDHCPNVITAQTRLLADSVLNFQTTQEEISLLVNMDRMSIKNYTDDEPDPLKVVKTEMTLDPDEFDKYQIGTEAEVTFCLKELRAILAFSEAANLPLSINFETAGKPIVFSIESDPTFEANFVLATLAEANSQASCSQQSTQLPRMAHTTSRVNNTTEPYAGNSTIATPVRGSGDRPVSNGTKPSAMATGDNTFIGGTPTTRTKSPTLHTQATSHSQEHRKKREREANNTSGQQHSGPDKQPDVPRPIPSTSLDLNATTERPRKSAASRISAAFEDFLNESDFDEAMRSMSDPSSQTKAKQDSYPSPVIPLVSDHSRTMADSDLPRGLTTQSKDNTSSGDDEEIPGTPPTKKFKSAFFGLSQSTIGSQSVKDLGAVLAGDSEEED